MATGSRRSALMTTGALVMLAGCGSSSSSSSGAGGSSSAQLTGSVSVWATWSGQEQAAFQQVLTGFQSATGVTANYQSKGDQLPTVLGTAIAGGAPPEVAILPQPGLLKDLVGKNALKPLDSIAGDIMSSDYAPAWKSLATVNGKLYGVYFKAANKSTVWYSVKAFKDAGVTPPKTWDDFVTALATIKAAGSVAPVALCGGDGWTLTDWFENVYLRIAGPDKYNQLATHKIAWTDDTVTQTFTVLNKMFADPTNYVGGTDHALSTGFPACVNDVFQTKKGAMVYEGDFVGTTIAGLGGLQAGTDYDYFTFPSVNGSPVSVSGGGDVAVMLKDTPQAEALMKYLAGPDAGTIWAKLGGFVSPNKMVNASNYPNDISKRLATDLVTAGSNFAFDMSDQAPSAFGGTKGQAEWADLQAWLKTPNDIPGVEAALEADAKKYYPAS